MVNDTLNDCAKAFEEYADRECLIIHSADPLAPLYAPCHGAWKAWQAAWNHDRGEMLGSEALKHLGAVLYFFAELHPDDQCKAFEDAIKFYNEKYPHAEIIGEEGFSIRRVVMTPLDDSPKQETKHEAQPAQIDDLVESNRIMRDALLAIKAHEYNRSPKHQSPAARMADQAISDADIAENRNYRGPAFAAADPPTTTPKATQTPETM